MQWLRDLGAQGGEPTIATHSKMSTKKKYSSKR